MSQQMKFMAPWAKKDILQSQHLMIRVHPTLLKGCIGSFCNDYHHTYGLPVIVSNCSNNYGSHHFPEKLIPLMINNIKNNRPLPVYGRGENVRDWLYVDDHAAAIDIIFHKGKTGEKYNIGGFNEWKNLDIVHLLCNIMDKKLGRGG